MSKKTAEIQASYKEKNKTEDGRKNFIEKEEEISSAMGKIKEAYASEIQDIVKSIDTYVELSLNDDTSSFPPVKSDKDIMATAFYADEENGFKTLIERMVKSGLNGKTDKLDKPWFDDTTFISHLHSEIESIQKMEKNEVSEKDISEYIVKKIENIMTQEILSYEKELTEGIEQHLSLIKNQKIIHAKNLLEEIFTVYPQDCTERAYYIEAAKQTISIELAKEVKLLRKQNIDEGHVSKDTTFTNDTQFNIDVNMSVLNSVKIKKEFDIEGAKKKQNNRTEKEINPEEYLNYVGNSDWLDAMLI